MKKVPTGVLPMGMPGGGVGPGAGGGMGADLGGDVQRRARSHGISPFSVLFRQERDLIRRMRP
jgi:hypothetical protein